MSLIQQALERANERAHTAAFEQASVSKNSGREQAPSASFFRKGRFYWGRKVNPRKVVFGICMAALIAGGAAIYFSMNHFEAASPPSAEASSSLPGLSVKPGLPKGNSKWVLNGITSAGSERLALINNQIVSVGDRLKENAVVKMILSRSVVLENQGKEVMLSLE